MTSHFLGDLPRTVRPISHRELLAAGVTERELRGPGWRHASHGWWAPHRSTRHGTAQRIVDATPHVPSSGALSGWAAAYVLGIDWCDGIDPWTGRELPVPINLGGTVGRGRHDGVRFVRHRLPAEDVVTIGGVRCTSALRTAFDGMRIAAHDLESLVVADAALHFEAVDLTSLRTFVDEHGGWAGVGRARRALRLADGRVRSPWESRLRFIYVIEARLPAPLVNCELLTTTGRFLAQPDLFDVEAGLAVDFDGLVHRDRDRHHSDNRREEIMEDHNIVVARVDSLGIMRNRPATIAGLQDAYRRGLRRNRRFDRWALKV